MDRRERLADARLYLIGDARTLGRVLDGALAGGVDVVQLRDKHVSRAELRVAALALADGCRRVGALFLVNDDVELAAEVGADGVHVGQEDASPQEARSVVGPERLVGVSTHSRGQIEQAVGVDYIGVGPVFATPTKPGRDAVGLELVRYAAVRAAVPFFAIGGIDHANVGMVRAAGAVRVAVVRAIGAAADPALAARELRRGE